MTQNLVFGAPQAVAFIATIIGWVFGSVFLFSRTQRPCEQRLFVGLTVWFLYLYTVWGAAGLLSGRSFWAAGFEPFELFLRSIPVLLKAL